MRGRKAGRRLRVGRNARPLRRGLCSNRTLPFSLDTRAGDLLDPPIRPQVLALDVDPRNIRLFHANNAPRLAFGRAHDHEYAGGTRNLSESIDLAYAVAADEPVVVVCPHEGWGEAG